MHCTDGQTFETGFIRSTLLKSRPKNEPALLVYFSVFIKDLSVPETNLEDLLRKIFTRQVIFLTVNITDHE